MACAGQGQTHGAYWGWRNPCWQAYLQREWFAVCGVNCRRSRRCIVCVYTTRTGSRGTSHVHFLDTDVCNMQLLKCILLMYGLVYALGEGDLTFAEYSHSSRKSEICAEIRIS